MADFAWLSNNLDIAYPFRTPAPSFDLGGTQRSLGNIIADATIYTSVEDDSRWKLYSFALTFAWPAVPTAGIIRVQSDTGHDFTLNGLHTDTTFNAWIYGRWLVTEWTKIVETPAGFSDYDIVVRVLWAIEELEDFSSLAKSETDWTDPAWLEDGIVRQGPKRVRRAFYKVGAFYFPLGSELRLAGGFNTDLVVKEPGDASSFRLDDESTSEVRPETTLLLSMPPGGGIGKYLRCAPQDLLRTLNGLGPDDQGAVHLAPKDCYWLERPLSSGPVVGGEQVDKTAQVYPNRLQLHSSCEECCSCAAYVDVYENLQLLWSLAGGASSRVYQALDDYRALREQYLTRTKGGQLVVKIGAVSSPGLSVSVAALVVNGGTETIDGSAVAEVEFRFVSAPDEFDVSYVDKTGLLRLPSGEQTAIDVLAGVTNSFTLGLTGVVLEPGNQVLWVGQFTVSASAALSRNAANLTITERLTIAGVLIDADTKSVELKGAEQRD